MFFELFLLRKISEWLERLTGVQKVVGSSPANWELRYFSE